EPVARSEVNLQRGARRPPVREARRVTQDAARGDLPQARVFADIVIPRQVLVERLVQGEFSPNEEVQNGRGEEPVGHTRGFKDRVVVNWLIRLCILHAEAVMPDEFAVAQQPNRKPRHIAVFHQLRDALFKSRDDLLFLRLRLQRGEGRFRRRFFLSEGAVFMDRYTDKQKGRTTVRYNFTVDLITASKA